jgi:hypothetical protein
VSQSHSRTYGSCQVYIVECIPVTPHPCAFCLELLRVARRIHQQRQNNRPTNTGSAVSIIYEIRTTVRQCRFVELTMNGFHSWYSTWIEDRTRLSPAGMTEVGDNKAGHLMSMMTSATCLTIVLMPWELTAKMLKIVQHVDRFIDTRVNYNYIRLRCIIEG